MRAKLQDKQINVPLSVTDTIGNLTDSKSAQLLKAVGFLDYGILPFFLGLSNAPL